MELYNSLTSISLDFPCMEVSIKFLKQFPDHLSILWEQVHNEYIPVFISSKKVYEILNLYHFKVNTLGNFI